jgi:hypothetical protein
VSIRRNKGMLVCDGGCGASLPTATADFNLLRKLKSKAGWYAVQEAGKWRDVISLVPGITMLLTPARRPYRKAACGKTARAV